MPEQPGFTAQQKDPRQLGTDLVQALAQLLAHNSRFLDDLHNARPLFFRGTVTALQSSGGMKQVQVQRAGQAAADGYWYPIYDAGYVATIGDDVLLLYTDRRLSACVIGARTAAAIQSTTVAVSAAGQGKVYGPLGTAPSGWHDPGYDDSAWAPSVANTLAGTALTVGGGAAWIGYSNTYLAGGETWLFRQSFGVAPGVLSGGTLHIQADDFILGAWVNGTLVYAPGAGSFAETEADPAIPASALLPGTTNLLAVEVQNYTGGGGNVSALAFRVDVGGVPTGGVTSVALAGPTGTTVSGSPVTGGGGTLSLAWASQSANTVLAGPTSGSAAPPTFRALVGADIPVDASTIISSAGTIKGNYQAGSGVSISGNTISATGSGGSVTSIALTAPALFSVSGSPVTTNGTLALTYAAGQTLPAAQGGTGLDGSAAGHGQLPIGNGSGFTLAALTAGSNVTITNSAGGISIAASGGGAASSSWATKTGAYTLTTSDTGILADATSGAFTLTLPTAVGSTARYSIKKKDTSANAVTLATTSSQTIDGATTLALASPGSTLDLISDGSNWYGAGGPRGRIGYAQVTAGQGSISSTATDLTGLSVTVTVGARPLRLTAFCADAYTTGAVGNRIWLNIYDTTAGAVLQQGVTDNVLSGGQDQSIACSVVVAPAAGSRSYKLQMHAEGSQTVTLSASSTNVAYLLVEEI